MSFSFILWKRKKKESKQPELTFPGRVFTQVLWGLVWGLLDSGLKVGSFSHDSISFHLQLCKKTSGYSSSAGSKLQCQILTVRGWLRKGSRADCCCGLPYKDLSISRRLDCSPPKTGLDLQPGLYSSLRQLWQNCRKPDLDSCGTPSLQFCLTFLIHAQSKERNKPLPHCLLNSQAIIFPKELNPVSYGRGG